MKNKTRPQEALIYGLAISVILLSLANSTFKVSNIGYKPYMLFITVFLVIIYIYCFLNLNYFWISIFGIIGIAYKFGYIKSIFETLTNVYSFIDNLYLNQFITPEYSNYFNQLMTILCCILAFIFYYFVVEKRKPLTIIVFGCTVFAVYFFMADYNFYNDCELFLLTSLFLMAYNNLVKNKEEYNYRNVKIDKNYGHRWFLYVSLFLVLVTFFISLLPYGGKPVKIEWVQKNVVDKFNGEGNGSYSSGKGKFSLVSTGYQPNPGRLGGEAKLRKVPALKVESDNDIRGAHLRGSIKDYYNGYQWMKTNVTGKAANLRKIENEKITMEPLKLQIFNYTNTATIFNALYPEKVEVDSGAYYVDSYNEISVEKAPKKSYTVSSLIPKIDKNTFLNAGNNLINKTDMDNYLKIPAEMPDRVYELTYKITDKYNNSYMKASAIENYLKKNYPYSLKTSDLPVGRDFVDYFLFEEKKGYCTYYATAMAVMARIAGIPSRYVEGYAVSSLKDKSSYTMVYESDAHAWVELYFKGIGWVTFDPTPGRDSNSLMLEDEKIATPEDNEEAEKDENIQPEKKPEESAQQNNEVQNKDKNKSKLIIFGTLVLGAAFIIIYNILKKSKRGTNIDRLMRKSIKTIIIYGKIYGVNYEPNETIKEYVYKLNKIIDYSKEDVSDCYDRYLYGSITPPMSDMKVVNGYIQFLKEKCEQKIGKIKLHTKYNYYSLSAYFRKRT
jgi:hypothetical protein